MLLTLSIHHQADAGHVTRHARSWLQGSDVGLCSAISMAGDANRMVRASLEEVRLLTGEMGALATKFGIPADDDSWVQQSPCSLPQMPAGSVPWSPSGQHLVTSIERKTRYVLVRPTLEIPQGLHLGVLRLCMRGVIIMAA